MIKNNQLIYNTQLMRLLSLSLLRVICQTPNIWHIYEVVSEHKGASQNPSSLSCPKKKKLKQLDLQKIITPRGCVHSLVCCPLVANFTQKNQLSCSSLFHLQAAKSNHPVSSTTVHPMNKRSRALLKGLSVTVMS